MAEAIDTAPALQQRNSSSDHALNDEKGTSRSSVIDEKGVYPPDKVDLDDSDIGDVFEQGPRLIDLGADGKERPIGISYACLAGEIVDLRCAVAETDIDYATRLLSLEDDPNLPIFTFRMWFLAVGLSCFSYVSSLMHSNFVTLIALFRIVLCSDRSL